MHIVISSIGTYGHVYPHIAIGQTLAQRGHDVQFLTCDYFREHVERAGLPFTSVLSSAQYLAGVRDPEVWKNPWRGVRASWRHLSPTVQQGYAALMAHIRPRESILVGNSLALWVRIAQEKFGNPAATIHLSPIALLSAKAPPSGILPGLELLPTWAIRTLLGLVERMVSDPIICPDVNRFRASLDLPPIRSVSRTWLHSPERVICAFPDWFAAPASDWPANTVCTGFPKLPNAEVSELDPGLLAFIEAGSPPIAFTPGSGVASSRVFFERALGSCKVLGKRAILATPFKDQLPDVLPDFAFHAAYVPYELLAPRVAVFVHAGGIGTIGLLLEAGTPQLFTPFTAEQTDNAMHAVALGVGLKLTPHAPLKTWTRALSTLLSQPDIRQACAKMKQKCGSERLAREQIADWIEQLNPEGNSGIDH
jgi:rhamnosyltransferase subunit B